MQGVLTLGSLFDGNSLAIPCSSDVLGRIAAFMEEEEDGSE
jgi:hypothetical protein